MTAREPRPALLPTGLRDRVLDAARERRAMGHALPEVEAVTTIEAFARAAAALDATLAGLDASGWARVVLRGLTVQQLVGHLIGVERDTAEALAGTARVLPLDHIQSTQASAMAQDTRAPEQTLAEWRELVRVTVALAEAAPTDGREYGIHGLVIPLDALMTIRAFEFWTHDNDIRAEVGLAASVPDPTTLLHMSALAARALPHAASLSGLTEAIDLRVVLTGVGGGTWDIQLNPQSGAATKVRIVADAVGFCRLAANRVKPAHLQADLQGDRKAAQRVLAALPSLALD